MTHLTDEQLNEFLDRALDPASRREAELHLQTCEECRARLASLNLVFQELALLPAPPLTADLRQAVSAALPADHRRTWTLALVVQFGTALGILLWVAVQAAQRISPAVLGLQFPISFFISELLSPRLPLPQLASPLPNPLNLSSLFSHLSLPSMIMSLPGQLAIPSFLLHPSAPSIASPVAAFHLYVGLPSFFSHLSSLPLPAPSLAALTVIALLLCGLANAALLRSEKGSQR